MSALTICEWGLGEPVHKLVQPVLACKLCAGSSVASNHTHCSGGRSGHSYSSEVGGREEALPTLQPYPYPVGKRPCPLCSPTPTQ